VLLYHGDKDFARSLLSLISNNFFVQDVYLRIIYEFVKGYYDYKAVDCTKGLEAMKEILAVARRIKAHCLYAKLQRVFDFCVMNSSSA
jgi:hypothetical protein